MNEYQHQKSVGVITLHYGLNYGAILQSWCVANLLSAKIIDHRYRSKLEVYDFNGPFKHLADSIDNHLPLSPTLLSTNGKHNAALEWMNKNCRAVVYGSDEIWKLQYRPFSKRRFVRQLISDPISALRFANTNQINPWFPAYPNIYWPELDIPSASFAASIGSMEPSTIPAHHKSKIRKSLSRLQFLGVRDIPTLDFARTCISPAEWHKIELMPDPVFSFSPTEGTLETVKLKLQKAGIDLGEPFAFVFLGKPTQDHVEACEELCPQVLNLAELPLNPFEWYTAIGLADFGITDRMHALIAALRTGTACLSIDQRPKSRELRSAFRLDRFDRPKDLYVNWPKDAIREECQIRESRLTEISQQLKNLTLN